LADPLAHVLGLEADQRHQGCVAEQEGWQGIHAFNAEPRLQPVEQDILHIGDHLPLHGGATGLCQHGHHADLVQEVEEIIQHCPFIQTVDPIDLLLARQASGDPRIIPVRHLPTPPLGHILGKLIVGVPHRPPPSADVVSALKESEHRIKTSAYVGISVVSL